MRRDAPAWPQLGHNHANATIGGNAPACSISKPALQPKTPLVRSARSRNRAAAWAYDLAQWREYQTLSHPNRRDGNRGEYARLEAAGPDFTRYHSGSAFAEAPLHSITREDRVPHAASLRFRAQRALSPRPQEAGPSRLTGLPGRAGRALELRRQAWARLSEPCHHRQGGHVQRANRAAGLSWLRLFGFLSWIRRIGRKRTALGCFRVVQASNAYRLTARLGGLGAMALNVFSGRGGHKCQASIEKGSAGKKTKPSADCSFDQFSRFEPQGRP